MEHASTLRIVPPRKKPREGHKQVLDEAVCRRSGRLNIQLPTGYGKTYAAAAVFRALYEAGEVNRMLYLVPTVGQLTQFVNDGAGDFLDAGLEGVVPFDIAYSGAQAIRRHRENRNFVFAATIQAVVSGATGLAVKELLQSGRWLVVVDEHHHYGIDKTWGRAVLEMPHHMLLPMSATPDRYKSDGAFGAPDIRIPYLRAVDEKAVKKLELHSYEYRVDAVTVNGEPVTFTTSTLADEVGSADPNAIDEYIVRKKLRWSPKYISPLLSIPAERLLARRGGYPLQMIVGGMGCLHARMVCDQFRSMFGDLLRVDWVGTGPHGRSDAENESIILKLCPPKVDGIRRPQDVKLDVLVHVGMAGEGLDSVFVSEVVHLNPANINNQNNQENGRAARRIPGAPEALQTAYINVDSSSPYAKWPGRKIMRVFDEPDDSPPEDEGSHEVAVEAGPREPSELPEEPYIIIADCQLVNIDKGDPEVKGCAQAMLQAGNWDPAFLDDPNHWIWERALELRRRELRERANNLEGMSVLNQLRQTLNSAVGSTAAVGARVSAQGRFERSLVGDMKKRIYSEMRKRFGRRVEDADEAELRQRYQWVRSLHSSLLAEGLPTWLR
jgi:superfamily II DNA or RNA helicase